MPSWSTWRLHPIVDFPDLAVPLGDVLVLERASVELPFEKADANDRIDKHYKANDDYSICYSRQGSEE